MVQRAKGVIGRFQYFQFEPGGTWFVSRKQNRTAPNRVHTVQFHTLSMRGALHGITFAANFGTGRL